MNRVFSPLQQFLITWLLFLVTGWVTLRAMSYVGELLSILITAGLIAFSQLCRRCSATLLTSDFSSGTRLFSDGFGGCNSCLDTSAAGV